MKKLNAIILFTLLGGLLQLHALDFGNRPFTAGKMLPRTGEVFFSLDIGTVHAAPEMEFPIEFRYRSGRQNTGLLGPGWHCPQLESSLTDSIWMTPWGEKIVFPDESFRFERQGDDIVGIQSCKGWKFTYRSGCLARILTPNLRVMDFIYENDRLTAVHSLDENFVTLSYKEHHLDILTVNGVKFQTTFDDDGLLRSVTPAGLAPWTFAYDVQCRLISLSQADYHDDIAWTADGTIEHDSFFHYSRTDDHEVELLDGNGEKQTIHYDGTRLSLKKTGTEVLYVTMLPNHDLDYPGPYTACRQPGRGIDIKMFMDPRRRLLALENADTRFQLQYDDKWQLTELSRRLPGEREFRPVTTFKYDDKGDLVSQRMMGTDGAPCGVTLHTYDDRHQPVLSIGTEGRIVYHRNDYGYLTLQGREDGQAYGCAYDAYNRPVQFTGARRLRLIYNTSGLVQEMQEMTGTEEVENKISYGYDRRGQLAQMVDMDGHVTKIKRDARGDVVAHEDPMGHVTSYARDAVGRITKVTDPNRNSREFNWRHGNLSQMTTAEGQMTEYLYNVHGQLEEQFSHTVADVLKVAHVRRTFDVQGRIVKLTDTLGRSVSMEYDKIGRLIRETVADDDETRVCNYMYDTASRLLEKTETVKDAHGRLTGRNRYQYSYDKFGRRNRLVVTCGIHGREVSHSIQWTYEEDSGRLEKIETDNHIVKLAYGANGKLSTRTIDGIETTFWYDQNGRLIRKNLGTNAVIRYTYGHGRLLSRELNGDLLKYEYDACGQLVKVSDANGKTVESYAYDPAGNLTDQLVNGVKTSFEYDRANQLVRSITNGTVTEYRYDAAGRMKSAGQARYDYGWGNRIRRIRENGRDSLFRYHSDGHLASDGKDEFLWDGEELLLKNETLYLLDPQASGKPEPIMAGDKMLFSDLHGTTLGTNDGNRFKAIERTGFGKAATADADVDLFTGRPLISNGSYQFLERNYLPMVGRWSSADPTGFPEGWNSHLYGRNAPTMGYDTKGAAFVVDDILITLLVNTALGAVFGAGAQILSNIISGKDNIWEGVGRAAAIGALSGLTGGAIGFAMKGIATFLPILLEAAGTTVANMVGTIVADLIQSKPTDWGNLMIASVGNLLFGALLNPKITDMVGKFLSTTALKEVGKKLIIAVSDNILAAVEGGIIDGLLNLPKKIKEAIDDISDEFNGGGMCVGGSEGGSSGGGGPGGGSGGGRQSRPLPPALPGLRLVD